MFLYVESEEEEEEMNTTAHHSALHYDAKDQGNPYIISTIVLSDMMLTFRPNKSKAIQQT